MLDVVGAREVGSYFYPYPYRRMQMQTQACRNEETAAGVVERGAISDLVPGPLRAENETTTRNRDSAQVQGSPDLG